MPYLDLTTSAHSARRVRSAAGGSRTSDAARSDGL